MIAPRTVQNAFLLGLIVLFSVLSFFVLKPYLLVGVFSLIIAIAIDPIYRWLLKGLRGKSGLAAFLASLFVLFAILIPILLFSFQIFQEAQNVYASLASQDLQSLSIIQWARGHFPALFGQSVSLNTYLEKALSFAVNQIGPLFSSVAAILLDFILMLISIFFILKNREYLIGLVHRVSPLPNSYDSILLRKIRESVNSVVRGSLGIALIHGIISGSGYALFGIPNPMLWGALTAFVSLLPMIGSSPINVPAILYLFMIGQTSAAIGLLVWWVVLSVLFLDRFIAPILMDRGLKIHPLLVMLAVLGGLSAFGPIGFILGPVTIAFLFSLLELHSLMVKEQE